MSIELRLNEKFDAVVDDFDNRMVGGPLLFTHCI